MSKTINTVQKKNNLQDFCQTDHFVAHVKEGKRNLFRTKTQSKKQSELKKASQELSKVLSQLDIWKTDLTVAVYHALPGELSPENFQKKYKNKCRFVFPKMKEKSHKMKFVFADLENQSWEPSPWPGGWQPSNEEEVPLQEIDVFLVPGLAFDREGHRLGRGKGFYDRVLCQAKGIKIGLAGVHQISDEILPYKSHDIKMDAVATDGFLFIPLKHSQFLRDQLTC